MKILFLTRSFYPHIGGVETHVREVGKCLVELGHEVTIVTEEHVSSSDEMSAKMVGNLDGMKIYRIPIAVSEKQKKYVIWHWLRQHKVLLREADVIHCHDVFFWYLPFRIRYPFKKVYTTFHGYETVYPPEKKAIRIRKFSERLSTGTICVGDFIKKWYGTRSTYVTYGGVTKEQSDDISYEPLTKKLRLSFIGRIENDTGVAQYILLLDLLQKNKIDFSFTAYGEGSLKHRFTAFGETPGSVENPSAYIKHTDIVFASSYLSMLQALVHKKLVIAFYDNPLKKDYLLMSPFTDYVIAEESPEDAFKKLKHFILNPNRLKKMITEGSSWAEEQTWDRVTEQYLKLWTKKR